MKLKFYHNIHHAIPIEPLIKPLKNRKKFIKERKPKYQQEMRLRCIRKVKGEIPEEVIKAGEKLVKAWEAYEKVWEAYDTGEAYDKEEACDTEEAYDKAWEAYEKALNKHKDKIMALHEKECPDCPYDWETGLVFPEGEG